MKMLDFRQRPVYMPFEDMLGLPSRTSVMSSRTSQCMFEERDTSHNTAPFTSDPHFAGRV
jgi:hypothetical protein